MLYQDYHSLYEIALKEERYKEATDSYLRELYLKTCLIREVQYYTNYSNDAENTVITEYTVHTAKDFIGLKSFYSPTYVENIYKDCSLPPSFLTIDEFKLSVQDMLTQIIFDYDKYNLILKKRLMEYAQI